MYALPRHRARHGLPRRDAETGVDPLNIAAHIYLALQELPAREVAAKQPAVVTVGRFQGGEAPNIIPGEAVLEGTIRTFDRELSAQLLRRIGEIAQATAAAFRGSAEVTELSSAPPLVNDPTLTNRARRSRRRPLRRADGLSAE